MGPLRIRSANVSDDADDLVRASTPFDDLSKGVRVRPGQAGETLKTTRKLADAEHAIARDHGFDTWKKFTNEIARHTGLGEKTAIWKSAEDVLIAGDDATLTRLFRKHDKMFRTEPPRSSWFGGLTPDYKDGEIVALLVAAGASVEKAWLNEENAKTDPRMFAALAGKSDRS